MLLAVGVGLPGLAGATLLLLTGWPFWVSTLISILMFAVLLPVTFTGQQFYDLRHRAPGPAAVRETKPAGNA